ncbi:hypothetical protein BMJ31_16930 [Sinorhizobium medicae]|nr:hypothetical protein BMJ31_16930 [Sinorhizobium medicae]
MPRFIGHEARDPFSRTMGRFDFTKAAVKLSLRPGRDDAQRVGENRGAVLAVVPEEDIGRVFDH